MKRQYMQKGLDDGIKEGEEKLKKEKQEIAKKLKNKGLDIKEISELTGLMETEINEIIK